MELKGSQTEQNLMKAVAGESQARNRYTFYASTARKEGFIQISSLFLETAENEKEHAKVFFNLLEGGVVEFTASYPAGPTGTTAANLLAAAEGEREEWEELYPAFAEAADEEGFGHIAQAFRRVAEVEVFHERRYRKLLENVTRGRVFARDSVTSWKCGNCGYVQQGLEAPEICPACAHPRSYYEVWTEPY